MEDAILVAIMPLQEFGQCFDETMNSVEYPFFDAVHKKIESTFCVDPGRQFYSGFSTGARLGYMLDCAFPDVLRAVATIQGAQPPLPVCRRTTSASSSSRTRWREPVHGERHRGQRDVMQNDAGRSSRPCPRRLRGGVRPTTPWRRHRSRRRQCVKAGVPEDGPIVFCSTIGQEPQDVRAWSVQAFWNSSKAF
jgi:hypothetical protein